MPVHVQHMAAQFMISGKSERHLNKMRKIYRDKSDYILKRLKSYDIQIKIEGALTGMHLTITANNGLSMKQCLKNAKKNNLKLKPYHYEDYPKVHPKFTLGPGGMKKEELEDRVNALAYSLVI